MDREEYQAQMDGILYQIWTGNYDKKAKNEIERRLQELFRPLHKDEVKEYDDLVYIYQSMSLLIECIDEKINEKKDRNRIGNRKLWIETIKETLSYNQGVLEGKIDELSLNLGCKDDWDEQKKGSKSEVKAEPVEGGTVEGEMVEGGVENPPKKRRYIVAEEPPKERKDNGANGEKILQIVSQVATNTTEVENKDDSEANVVLEEIEKLTRENMTFEELKRLYDEMSNIKRNIAATSLEGKKKEILEVKLEHYITKLKNKWIQLFPERATEILEYCNQNTKGGSEDLKVVLVQIEKRLKAVGNGYIINNTLAQGIVDQVVQDTNELLINSKLSNRDLEQLLTIYEEVEEGLKLTKKTEYLQLAVGFMTQITEEKKDQRAKIDEANRKDAKDREAQWVNEELERILDELEKVIIDAEQKNKIENGTLISIKSKKLLEQKKLTPEQINRLFDAYANAKKALDKLDKKTKEQPSVKSIIETAEEFKKKREIAAGIKYDSKQAVEAKEKEKEKQIKEIEKKIKIREEIDQILKKYKSNIKKFISAYETVKQISEKYGEKSDTYKQLSDKIKELEEEIPKTKEKVKTLIMGEQDESRADKRIRHAELKSALGKLTKQQNEMRKLQKDIKTYNEAFKAMKNIRTSIAKEVSSSNEWSKTTRNYINEKSKSNQTFYGLTKEKQAEKDFEVSQEEIDEVKTKAEEVRWLKYEEQPEKEGQDGKKGKNKESKKAGVRSEETTLSTTQRSGGKEEVRSKSKFKALKDKLFKSKKAKDNDDVDYEVDEYKKIELWKLSDEAKRKMAFKYYRDNSNIKFFGTIWAFCKSITSRGRAKWEREFLKKEERAINPDYAAKYRENFAKSFGEKSHIQTVAAKPMVNGTVKFKDGELYQDEP